MKNYHLVSEDDAWKLKAEGATRATKVFEGTKTEATQASAAFLKGTGVPSSLKIHLETGRMQEERTYPGSADPHSTKG